MVRRALHNTATPLTRSLTHQIHNSLTTRLVLLLLLIVTLGLIKHHRHSIITQQLTDTSLSRCPYRIDSQIPKARASNLIHNRRLTRTLIARYPCVRSPLQATANNSGRNPASQQVAIDRRIPAHLVAQLTDHPAIVVACLCIVIINV